MERVLFIMSMETSLKETGKTIRPMAMESTNTQMEPDMKVTGNKTYKMDME